MRASTEQPSDHGQCTISRLGSYLRNIEQTQCCNTSSSSKCNRNAQSLYNGMKINRGHGWCINVMRRVCPVLSSSNAIPDSSRFRVRAGIAIWLCEGKIQGEFNDVKARRKPSTKQPKLLHFAFPQVVSFNSNLYHDALTRPLYSDHGSL